MIDFSFYSLIIQILHYDFAEQNAKYKDFSNQRSFDRKLPFRYRFLNFHIFRMKLKIIYFVKIIIYLIFNLIFSSMPLIRIFHCICKTFSNHAYLVMIPEEN